MSRRKRTSARKEQTSKSASQRRGENESDSAKRSPVLLMFVLAAFVAVIVLAVHWPVLSAQAIFLDDNQYLLDNPLVQHPGWASAKRFLAEVRQPSTVAGYYQPLSMISLMIDYSLGGRADDLNIFHCTSLTLHVCNTLLVVVILFLLFGRPLPAALIGLLFGIHPMTVETIAWISERKTLLATFLALWSVICYLRYTKRSGWGWYSCSLLTYALALMAKPTTTMLPVMLLLLDYWPLRRLGRRAIVEKLPLFFVGGMSAIVTLMSQAQDAGVWFPAEQSRLATLWIVCHNIVFYLFHMFWPINLSSYYPCPSPLSLSHPMVLAGFIGTCVLIVLLLFSWRWTRAFVTGWLIFMAMILPTLGVIGFTNLIASDRYAYLPSLGILMILAWLIGLAWSRWPIKGPSAWRPVGLAAVIVLAAVLEMSGARTNLAYWRDGESLYQHLMTQSPNSAKLHAEYGDLLVFHGRKEQAVAEFQKALQFRPDYPWVHNNIGVQFLDQGRIQEAEHHFSEAARLEPESELYQLNLSIALSQLGKTDQAIDVLNQLVKRPSNNPSVYYNLGVLLAQRGKKQEAIQSYRQSLRLRSDAPKVYYALGFTLEQAGEFDQAIDAYRKALQFNPNDKNIQQRLNMLSTRKPRTNEP